MAKWKEFKQIDKSFFNFAEPEQPTAKIFGTWGLTKVYKLEDIIVNHNPEYEGNYTQLAKPSDAAILADSLASRFGHPSLVGTLGRWFGYYTPPDEKSNEKVAKYNLESIFYSDYKRHIEYIADATTGKVTIKYVCDEPVPEKVIAKDLHKLYKALAERKGYFVQNAKADDKKEKTPAAAETDAKDEEKAPASEYDALPDKEKAAVNQMYDAIKNMPVQEFYKKVLPVLAAAAGG